MSETVMLTSNPYDAKTASAAAARSASRCPASGCACATTTGRRCPTGEIGGIEVRGPERLHRLLAHAGEDRARNSPPTAGSSTGDVGSVDARGYVTIVGRSKDLIITGGYNVYPAEVEGFSTTCPASPKAPWSACRTPTSARRVVAVVVAQRRRRARRRRADRAR